MLVVNGEPVDLIGIHTGNRLTIITDDGMYIAYLDPSYSNIHDAIKDAVLKWGCIYLPELWFYVGAEKLD